MSEDKKYNGYTNYETWLAALWLDNDPGQNEMMADKVEELTDNEDFDPYSEEDIACATTDMADYIKQLVEDWIELEEIQPNGFIRDLVNAAVGAIDYRDIAESQLADAIHEKKKAA